MSGFVKTFKLKDGDKNKYNETMFFRIDVEKLLEKYKTIEDWKIKKEFNKMLYQSMMIDI